MLTGRCRCGAVRYRMGGPVGRLLICHCDHCRRQTGSAFDVALECQLQDIMLIAGQPRHAARIANSGNRVSVVFCGDCGCHLWEGGDGDGASLKVGCLDQPVDVSGAIHLYVGRRLPGIVIPDGAIQYPGEPD